MEYSAGYANAHKHEKRRCQWLDDAGDITDVARALEVCADLPLHRTQLPLVNRSRQTGFRRPRLPATKLVWTVLPAAG